MKELVCNLHNHSTYSDGTGSYTDIAQAAIRQAVDVVIITDHNILVKGVEGYYENNGKKALLLTGEEVHDQDRQPQKNHTLVIGANREVAAAASDPQTLMDEVSKVGGLAYLAHPHEYDLPMFREPDISWVSWDVQGFTGLELWNGFSEFKTYARTIPRALFYAFFPEFMAHAPHPSTLQKWDELLSDGKKVYAVGGSDAHALDFHKGFFHKAIFPYDFHFSAINNHILVQDDLSGEVERDARQVYSALKNGCSYVGYDLPAPTRGFTFTLETEDQVAQMGESVQLVHGGTIRIHTPTNADVEIVHNNRVIQRSENTSMVIKNVTEKGYYRVQCRIDFMGQKRGWIFSNPIFCGN